MTEEEIQKKSLHFLSKLYGLSMGDYSKQFDLYEIGKELGFNKSVAEQIVDHLSRIELISREESSDKIAITEKGANLVKSEKTVEYPKAQ